MNHYLEERVLAHSAILRCAVGAIRELNVGNQIIADGQPMYYRPWKGDYEIIREVWKEEVYPAPKPGWSVLDAGAHIGAFSRFARYHVGVRGRVIAVEPDPRNLRMLRLNTPPSLGVEVFPYALSDRAGSLTLRCSPIYSATTHSGSAYASDYDVCRAPTIALDSLRLEHLDMIKMDIEGMELSALKGAEQTLRRFHPLIAMEYHRADLGSPVEAVKAFLHGLDYRTEQRGGEQGYLVAQ